jgi:CHAT domain/NB-ARC domain/APAF-1 helical domain
LDLYTNILIRIFARNESSGAYPVEASLDEKRFFKGGQLYLDRQSLLMSEVNPQEYGLKLFNALFLGPIRRAYDRATGIAENRTGGRLRIQLWIDDTAPELHTLYWERLYHEHRGQVLPIATSTLTPFSRYIGLELAEPLPISERPIRLLIAIANPLNLPKGLSPINVDLELAHLLQKLGDLRQEKQIQITVMPGRSGLSPELSTQLTRQGYQILEGVTSLDNILQNLPEHHIFHFLGHGHFKKEHEDERGVATLFLEKADGSWAAITEDILVPRLTAADPLPYLVFLAACESARQDTEGQHPFVGLGPRLARAGIPAVIAMQDIVPMDLMREVISNFYHRLIEHGIIDKALNEARLLLFEQDARDWATPMLFMRLHQGQLFARESISFTPFQSPPLPPYFVSRPDVINALKNLLLADEPAIQGVLVVRAIHGLGGVGKSTQAAALTRDPLVRQRFTDGVLWVTLGQEPDILSLLSGWIQDLGDYTFRPPGIEAATARLRSLLQKKAVLMVVDDAWNPAHVKLFQAGGMQCRMLITTREAHIATALDATLYDLDVMTADQALELLSKRVGREFKGQERDDALNLARTVGYLPLALELAAAQVVDDVPWSDLLAELSAEIARLEALDYPGVEDIEDIDDPIRKRLSLIACFNLSLRKLSEERRWMYAWLGILPHDLMLTTAMTTTLWDRSFQKSRDTLHYFRSKALLLPGVPHPDGTRTYRLHDLLHSMARRLLTDSPETENHGLAGFGLTLKQAHMALLERYKKRLKNALWHTLPDDGYIHSHLTWHMEQAGQIETIHTLLLEEQENRNAWYQAHERLGQTAEFLEDVQRAWRLVEKDSQAHISQEKRALNIALEVRYSLITASLNTLAQNIPPPLLTALVEKGIWTPTEGIAYALHASGAQERAETLVQLVPLIPDESLQDEMLRKALGIAEAIENEREREKILASLAAKLGRFGYAEKALVAAKAIRNVQDLAEVLASLAPELVKLGYAEKALAVANAIKNRQHRTIALIGFIPHLRDPDKSEMAQQALGEIHRIKKNRRRVRLLLKLIPHLSGVDKDAALRTILATVERIRNETLRVELLLELLPHLPTPLYNEVLTLGRRFKNNLEKVRVLETLAAYLPEPAKEEVFRSTLLTIWDISNERERADALIKIAPLLPKQFHTVALEIANSIKTDEIMHLKVVVILAVYLEDQEKETLLARNLIEILAIENEEVRMNILAEIIPYLPEHLRRQALASVKEIEDPAKQVEVLVRVIPHLPEGSRQRILTEALELVFSTESNPGITDTIIHLAPFLPDWQLHGTVAKTLDVVSGINDKRKWTAMLAELISQMPEWLQLRALSMARAIDDKEAQTKALIRIQQADSEKDHIEKLARLSSWLIQAKYLYEASVIAWLISDLPKQVEPLVEVIARLIELDLPQEALAATQLIKSPAVRAEMFLGLLSRLPLQQKNTALPEALAAIRNIEDNPRRAELFVQLIPHLGSKERFLVLAEALAEVASIPPSIRQKALVVTTMIEDVEQRVKILLILLPHLPEAARSVTLEEALEVTWSIGNVVQWAEALLRLMPYLPETLRCATDTGAMAAVRRMGDRLSQADMLVGLAVAGHPQQALTMALLLISEVLRVQVLLRLMLYLPEIQKSAAVIEILAVASTIVDVTPKARILIALLPLLSKSEEEEVINKALAATRLIRNPGLRAELLLVMMPYLPEDQLVVVGEEIQRIIQEDENLVRQAEALDALKLYIIMPEPEISVFKIEEWLASARGIRNSERRAEMFVSLMPQLPGEEKEVVTQETLIAIRAIKNPERRGELLIGMIPHVPEGLKVSIVEEVLRAAWSMGNAMQWGTVMLTLMPYLPEPLTCDVDTGALQAIKSMGNWMSRIDVLVRLAQVGYPRQALVAARMIIDTVQRVRSLIALLPHIPDSEKDFLIKEIQADAHLIYDTEWLTKLLPALLPHLSESAREGAIKEALASIKGIKSVRQRIEIQVSLLPYLSQLQRVDIIEKLRILLRNIADPELQMEMLFILIPHLSKKKSIEIIRIIQMKARKIRNVTHRARIVARLIEYLPEWQRSAVAQKTFTYINTIKDPRLQVEILGMLMPHLSEQLKAEAVLVALETIEKVRSEKLRVEMLVVLIPHLSEKQKTAKINRALIGSQKIKNAVHWAEALLELMPYLSEPVGGVAKVDALATVRKMGEQMSRVDVTVGLARAGYPQQALILTRMFENGPQRTTLLAMLIPHLSGSEKDTVTKEVMRVRKTIRDFYQQSEMLVMLIPHLSEDEQTSIVEEVLRIAQLIPNAVQWAEVLLTLMPYLPEPLRCMTNAGALAVVRNMENWISRVDVLVKLAQAGYPRQASVAVRTIRDIKQRIRSLVALLPYVAGSEKDILVKEALGAARQVHDKSHPTEIFTVLIPHLLEEEREMVAQEAFVAARTITNVEQKTRVLLKLMPYLPEIDREAALEEALAGTRSINKSVQWAEAMLTLMPYLPEPLRCTAEPGALVVVRSLGDWMSRVDMLVGLAQAGYPQQALVAAHMCVYENEILQTQAILRLTPYLPEVQKNILIKGVMAFIRTIKDPEQQTKTLILVISYLTEAEQKNVVEEALITSSKIEDMVKQARVFVALLPYLSSLQTEMIIHKMLEIFSKIKDWKGQINVLTGLIEAGYPRQTFALIHTIENMAQQTRLRALLIPHLRDALKSAAIDELVSVARLIDNGTQHQRAFLKIKEWLLDSGYITYNNTDLRVTGKLSKMLADGNLHLPDEKWQSQLASILKLAQAIEDTTKREEIESALTLLLESFSLRTLYPLWSEMLHLSSVRMRQDLLADIGIFAPVLAILGGTETLQDVASSIQDIGKWWP